MFISNEKHMETNDKKLQKITPFLWFEYWAEEAVNYYINLFENSWITSSSRYDKAWSEVSWMPEWSIMTIWFQLEWQEFVALNWGPPFKFTPAISFVINCETQEEVDKFWNKFSEWWKPDQCWWITDKYGVTWQVVPTILDKLLQDKDTEKAWRVMEAMLKMKKIDIEILKKAYNG